MSDVDIFGPLVVDTEPGLAMEATLQEWFPTYASYLSRALVAAGVDIGGDLPLPGAYVHSSDANHFPEETPPAIVIATPSTLGEPKRDSKNYRAFWDVRVVAYVDSNTRDNTEHLAKYYATLIRAIVVHHPSLGDFAEGTVWRGTSYGIRVPDKDQRTLGSCEVRFEVDVRDVVQQYAGPPAPITTVPPSWPTADSVTLTVAPTPIS
jgi:hypothetical protein